MTGLKAALYQGVEELSESECLEIARRKMRTSDLTVENVAMKPLSETPTGFLGDHYKVAITVRLGNLSDDGKRIDLNFFVKTKPRNSVQTEFGEDLGAFQRECDFFTTLVALLRSHTSNAGGSDEDVGNWTPDCFFSNAKLIVLDDLSHQGFRMEDGRPGFDLEHCMVTFKTLATFHASSIIYEEKEGQRLGKKSSLIEIFPKMLTEVVWTKDAVNATKQMCGAGALAMEALVKRISQTSQSPARYEKALVVIRRLFEEGCRVVETPNHFRNVVCHGDLWANNILFRYDASGAPQEARLIDFQLVCYHPPACDFMSTIYLATRRETREKHFLALAKAYHSTLAQELSKNQLRVEEILPWSEFEASLEHFRMLGFLMCFYYYPTILLSDEATDNVAADPDSLVKFMLEDQSAVALKSFETDVRYRERMCELVEEFADLMEKQHISG